MPAAGALEGLAAERAALQTRDAAATRVAMNAHMDYVEKALEDERKAKRNAAIARQRYEPEKHRSRK